MFLLGITGTDGAGKGTVVEYLASRKGFFVCSARAILERELEARGLPKDRANLRLMGNELRRTQSADVLVSLFLARAEEARAERAILDSVRALAEVKRLKAEDGFLVAVDADQNIRYERVIARASESDRVDFETFMAQEALEMNDPAEGGMQKAAVMAAADATLMNNGTREELYAQVDAMLEKFFARG